MNKTIKLAILALMINCSIVNHALLATTETNRPEETTDTATSEEQPTAEVDTRTTFGHVARAMAIGTTTGALFAYAVALSYSHHCAKASFQSSSNAVKWFWIAFPFGFAWQGWFLESDMRHALVEEISAPTRSTPILQQTAITASLLSFMGVLLSLTTKTKEVPA